MSVVEAKSSLMERKEREENHYRMELLLTPSTGTYRAPMTILKGMGLRIQQYLKKEFILPSKIAYIIKLDQDRYNLVSIFTSIS